jgi:hypothetical protein
MEIRRKIKSKIKNRSEQRPNGRRERLIQHHIGGQIPDDLGGRLGFVAQ